MTLSDVLAVLVWRDLAALVLLAAIYAWIGWRIEHPRGRPSVTVMMDGHRRAWMEVFRTREVRIFDSQILASLRNGTAFFASTALIAIGGVLALIGNPQPLEGMAEGLLGKTPELLWQIKLIPVALFLAIAFLNFVWAQRLFGYCAVLMGAVPNAPDDPDAPALARVAGEMNVRAAWNFNRGLRALYFALGALAWLIGPEALVLGTLGVTWVLWSREFRSIPNRLLAEGPSPAAAPVSGRSSPP